VHALLIFLNTGASNLSAIPLPPPVLNDFKILFKPPPRQGFEPGRKIKLLSFIFIAILNYGEGELFLKDTLTTSLQCNKDRAKEILRLIGCRSAKSSNSSDMFELKAPLIFPKVRLGRKRK